MTEQTTGNAEMASAKALRALVVMELRRAKARGDDQEARALREWIVSLVVQGAEAAMKSDPLARVAAWPIFRERSGHATREELLREAWQLDELERGVDLLRHALDAIRQGDHDRTSRLLGLLCDVWGLPRDEYGLD